MAKQDDPRRARDAAGIGPYARERERLVPLSQMGGWNVIDGEPDIRSWEVKTLSGRVLGHVRELLVDVLNVLNGTAEEDLVTDDLFSPNFGRPNAFMDPRRAMVGLRLRLGRQ